jgi:hypothetical protein
MHPVPGPALLQVEMLQAVGLLHDQTIAYDKSKGHVFLQPVDVKLVPVGWCSSMRPDHPDMYPGSLSSACKRCKRCKRRAMPA